MSRQQPKTEDYMRNMALAVVAGQAGCSTLVVVFAALFAGLYLDSHLGTRPLFTIGLLVASVPISLYAMVRLILSSVAAIVQPESAEAPEDKLDPSS